MLKITNDQHRNILGFAIIGYSLQFIIYIWTNLQILLNGLFLDFNASYITKFITGLFSINIVFFIVTLISGLVILGKHKFKYASLGFVFFCISFFPLGTFLSFYILYYLFVITDGEAKADTDIKEEISS